jgi:uncharacterized protein YdeI (YjbR/CyaY-like superfamily)
MKVIPFASPAKFRAWLEKNHDKATELWVGLYKREARPDAMSYKQAVDEALCIGWIDGVRKAVDAELYTIRFTPRKPRSYWSLVNTRRAEELIKLGHMTSLGLAIFEKREKKDAKYSFENRPQKLAPAYEKQFRANSRAWEFFQAQAPWYQRTSCFWVMSAKQEETQRRRLSTLIADSAANRRIAILTSKKKLTKKH